MSIADNVKAIREMSDMTVQEFATYVGLSHQVIWQLEHGLNKNPSMRVLSKLADETNNTIDFIVGRTERMPTSTETHPDYFIKAFHRNYYRQSKETKLSIAKTILTLFENFDADPDKVLTVLRDELNNPLGRKMGPTIADGDFLTRRNRKKLKNMKGK
jgi:transcriptional regulator with XRE-family HTH domain